MSKAWAWNCVQPAWPFGLSKTHRPVEGKPPLTHQKPGSPAQSVVDTLVSCNGQRVFFTLQGPKSAGFLLPDELVNDVNLCDKFTRYSNWRIDGTVPTYWFIRTRITHLLFGIGKPSILTLRYMSFYYRFLWTTWFKIGKLPLVLQLRPAVTRIKAFPQKPKRLVDSLDWHSRPWERLRKFQGSSQEDASPSHQPVEFCLSHSPYYLGFPELWHLSVMILYTYHELWGLYDGKNETNYCNTPPKTNMEPPNQGLEDDFLFKGVIFTFHVRIRKVVQNEGSQKDPKPTRKMNRLLIWRGHRGDPAIHSNYPN